MKKLIVALCFLSTLAFGQNPQPVRIMPRPCTNPGVSSAGSVDAAAKVLPENYLLKLVVTEKDQQIGELSLVVATEAFASNADPQLGFAGTLTMEEDGTFVVRYALSTWIEVTNGPVTQGHNGSANTTVRLRNGEPLEILKTDKRTYQLTVSRLADSAKKAK